MNRIGSILNPKLLVKGKVNKNLINDMMHEQSYAYYKPIYITLLHIFTNYKNEQHT